jgi:hypothetical protein
MRERQAQQRGIGKSVAQPSLKEVKAGHGSNREHRTFNIQRPTSNHSAHSSFEVER